jgi:MYXO-CTERM domain-containing protein
MLIALVLLATPDFPAVIQQQLNLAQPPRCTVCHETDAGGIGTVVKPFGVYLVSRGLREGDETSLKNALLADAGEKHSSNGRTSDIDALKAGEDPNGTPATAAVPDPAHGCSTGSPAGLLGLLAFLVTRRRHAGQTRHP